MLADEVFSLRRSAIALLHFRPDRVLPELNPVGFNHLFPYPEFKSPLRFDDKQPRLLQFSTFELEPMLFNKSGERPLWPEKRRVIDGVACLPGARPRG